MIKYTLKNPIISFEPSFTSIAIPRKHKFCRFVQMFWWSFMEKLAAPVIASLPLGMNPVHSQLLNEVYAVRLLNVILWILGVILADWIKRVYWLVMKTKLRNFNL